MARQINWGPTNDALRRMANFFMQNKLGEMGHARTLDTILQQGKMYQENMAESDRLQRERGAQEHKQRIMEEMNKFQYDLAKLEPMKRLMALKQISSDPKEQETITEQMKQMAIAMAPIFLNARTGKTSTPEQIQTGFNLGFSMDDMRMLGTQEREAREFGITSELEKRKTSLDEAKFGLEKEKFGAEQGQGGSTKPIKPLTQKEYYNTWKGRISEARNNLKKMLEDAPERGMSISEETGQLINNQWGKDVIIPRLKRLNMYETAIRNGRLNPSQEQDLNAIDIKELNETMPAKESPAATPTAVAPTTQPAVSDRQRFLDRLIQRGVPPDVAEALTKKEFGG